MIINSGGMKVNKHYFKKVCACVLSISMIFGLVQDIAKAEEQPDISNTVSTYSEEPEVSTEDKNTLEEPIALYELDDEREENVKRFLMSDHTVQAILYSEPVHYMEDGEWKDIDNTLSLEKAQDSEDFTGYTNAEGDFSVKIAHDASQDKLVKIEKDNYKIEFQLAENQDENSDESLKATIKNNELNKGSLSELRGIISDEALELKTESDSVIYEGITDSNNTDLEYQVTGSGLKENIIINSKQNEYNYTFHLKTDNLKLELKNNEITAYDPETKEVIYYIPAPFMYDANDKVSTNVTYSLNKVSSGYELTVSADKNWINGENIAFPVTVDPIVRTEQTDAAISSTFISSKMASTNFFSGYAMLMTGVESSSYYNTRTLVKFDLPELSKGDMIVSAYLNLQQYESGAYSSNTPPLAVNAHKITSSWNVSTVNWSNQPGIDNNEVDYSYINKEDGNTSITKTFDITKTVKEWYDGDSANNGLMLKADMENTQNTINSMYAKYKSEKYNSTTGAYPVIILKYRNTKGIEDYYSYTTLQAGNAGAANINNYTGNLYFEQNSISTSGLLMPASAYLTYNTNNSDKKQFNSGLSIGYGWKLSLEQYIEKTGITDYPYRYIDADGTEHYFKKLVDGTTTTYIDEDGLGLSLIPNIDNTYTMIDSQDNIYNFNTERNLVNIKDANGNITSITYSNGIIQSVTDGSGKKITFVNSSGVLTQIKDPANRVTKFTVTNGQLVQVTNPDGSNHTYSYVSNAIDKITDSKGYMLDFDYKSAGMRVSSVLETGNSKNGQKIGFDYKEYNTTKITTAGNDNTYGSNDDIITTYQFDDYGRLISTQAKSNGKQLGSSLSAFTSMSTSVENIKKINKVTSNYGLGASTVNLLKNHNAEKDSDWTLFKSGTSSESVGYSNSYHYIGNKSLKIGVSSATNDSSVRYRQMLTNEILVPGKTYTFSGYIKTVGLEPLEKGKYGVALLVYSYYDDGRSAKSFYSDFITSTTDVNINEGWRRQSVTFTVPTDASRTSVNLIVKNANGATYFDALQLEAGNVANEYNLIENAGFEDSTNLYGYTASNLNSSTDLTTTTSYIDGKQSFKITGAKKALKSISQEVIVSGSESDTYIISGWTKAYAVPAFIKDTSSDIDRKYKISIKVTYTDGTYVWKDAANFNLDVTGWQYGVVAIDLSDDNASTSKTPANLTIYPRYDYQANTVYFDNLSIVKANVTNYSYDTNGNLTSAVNNAEQSTSMGYDNNDLTSVKDANGNTSTYSYDKHNLTQAVSQKKVTSDVTYNTAGLPLQSIIRNSSSTMKIQTDTTYTDDGAYISKTYDQDGYETSYSYDQNKGILNSTTDPGGNTTSYTYNANTDQLTEVSGVVGGKTISNAYDYDKDLLKKISHNGIDYNFSYDDFGNTSEIKVGNQFLTSYQYEVNNGSLSQVTYGNGDTNSFTYDEYGNITQTSVNGIPRFLWNANSNGNIIRHEDLKNQLLFNYEYDINGRLIRQDVEDTSKAIGTDRNSYLLEYGYDANNNVDRFVNKAGSRTLTHQYTYGLDNLLTTYNMPTGKNVSYTYDGLNRLQQYQIGTTNPITVELAYALSNRNVGEQRDYRTTKIYTEGVGNKVTKYSYDKLGNVTEIYEKTGDSSYVLKNSYEYDELSQLIRENDVEQNLTKVYTYDLGDNIISIKEYAYTLEPINDLQPQNTINYQYADLNWKDKLTSYNEQPITYDTIGNPISYNGYTLDWDNGRELVSLSGNGIENATYTYDADGLRTTKTVNGVKTTYEYVGGQLLYEKKGDTEIHYLYDANGSLRGIQTVDETGASKAYYVVTNTRGDVTQIYDEAGTLQVSYSYDAWGKILSIKDGNGNEITDDNNIGKLNSLRYRGYYYDDETGLYYLQSRYYDSNLLRMLNSDESTILFLTGKYLLGNNLFIYCGNNPIMNSDPTGYVWKNHWWNSRWFISNAINTAIFAAVGGSLAAVSSTFRKKAAQLGTKYAGLWLSDTLKRSTLIKIVGAKIGQYLISTANVIFNVLMWASDPGGKLFDYLDARESDKKTRNNGYLNDIKF
jgi:RHS repeat-associated protein